jgi:hypothetical protein
MRNPTPKGSSNLARLVLAQTPFIVMLACAFFGVAYTSVSRHGMGAYWMILVPAFGLTCVAIAWRKTTNSGNWRAALFQSLHWAAVLLAMNLALIADMEKAMSAEATALMLLVILALGTATAGLHLRAWAIVIVGVVLAMGVPIFAWLEERTLLFALGGLGIVAVAGMILVIRNHVSIVTQEQRHS